MNESVTIPLFKLCEIKLHVKMKAKLSWNAMMPWMRECRQEIEVLHKAPKKPVRKPTA